MAQEVSAGGVVYTMGWGQPRILLILDVYGQWTLPKGHVEPDESLQQAALREIEEEVGLKGRIEKDLGEVHYQFSRDSQVVDKTVHYYLIRAPSAKLRLAPGEVRAAEWVPLERVSAVSGYTDNQPVLEKAIALLRMQAA